MADLPTPLEQGMAHLPTPLAKDMAQLPMPLEQEMAQMPTPLEQGMAHVPTPLGQGMSHLPAPLGQGMAHLPTPLVPQMEEFAAEVYEPAEDTYLALDALEADALRLRAAAPAVCLEVGTGSGVLTAFLATILGEVPAMHLATDINPRACDLARHTWASNGCGARCDVVQCDLVGALASRLTGLVDVLLFNPPYVVTPSEEVASVSAPNLRAESSSASVPNHIAESSSTSAPNHLAASASVSATAADTGAGCNIRAEFRPESKRDQSVERTRTPSEAASTAPGASKAEAGTVTSDASLLSASWAGGRDGREVIDRLLPDLARLLAPRGVCYLVLEQRNRVDDVADLVRRQGLRLRKVLSRRAGAELLHVVRISRSEATY